MEWYSILLVFIGVLLLLMATGMPVAFCFMSVNLAGAYLVWGGEAGFGQLVVGMFSSVTTFTLLPLPLFILMGEVMAHSGISSQLIETLDKWLGRLPGRLSLLAVMAGVLFSTLTGASMASVAMLGAALVPEMEKHHYKDPMTLGPILGSGGLAIMIPPSSLAVLLGAVGEISIGRILIAIILPGILMAAVCAGYIIVRCILQPSVAPAYEVITPPLREKVRATVRYVLPLGIVIFMVVGFIFFGIASPTEAAATGALGTFLLAAVYKRLNWTVFRKALYGTAHVTVMLFVILTGAMVFSQILATSGATVGLVQFTVDLPVSPINIIIAIMLVILILGCFMEIGAIVVLTAPLFVPIIRELGFDTVWFAVIFLISLEMGTTTPPFGLSLFVMKGVVPDRTMKDIYLAGLPFLCCSTFVMAFIIFFPAIALWLPKMMR